MLAGPGAGVYNLSELVNSLDGKRMESVGKADQV
jgi:hypothetical protein